jgi:hypothetical protein
MAGEYERMRSVVAVWMPQHSRDRLAVGCDLEALFAHDD